MSHGLIGTILGLAAFAGAAVGVDPADPDFLKIRWGKFHYDLGAGLQQDIRLIWKLLRTWSNPTQKGRKQDAAEITLRFLRGKLSPLPGYGVDWWTGKKFTGEKFHPGWDTLALVTPLIVNDLYTAAKEEGWLGVGKALPAPFGVGVQIYEPKPKSDTGFSLPERGVRNGVKEPEEIYKKRVERAKQWHEKFGRPLLSDPKFTTASPEDQKRIKEIFQRRVTEESQKAAPDTGRLQTPIILEASRQSKHRSA